MASARAHGLIEAMLKEMQQGIENPDYCASEHWERLFGPKQSMVVNLQKLVAALVALPGNPAQPQQAQQPLPFTPEEMALLSAWIADGE